MYMEERTATCPWQISSATCQIYLFIHGAIVFYGASSCSGYFMIFSEYMDTIKI